MNSASIVPLEQLEATSIQKRGGLRERPAFVSLVYDGKPLYIVVGTKEQPAITPHGIKQHDKWQSFSVDCGDSKTKHLFENIDDVMRELVAEYSVDYKPLLYESGDLYSLSGALQDVQIVDANNRVLFWDSMGDLIDLVPASSEVRVVFKLANLFFPSHSTECKVTVKVCKIQVLKRGVPLMDMFAFD